MEYCHHWHHNNKQYVVIWKFVIMTEHNSSFKTSQDIQFNMLKPLIHNSYSIIHICSIHIIHSMHIHSYSITEEKWCLPARVMFTNIQAMWNIIRYKMKTRREEWLQGYISINWYYIVLGWDTETVSISSHY